MRLSARLHPHDFTYIILRKSASRTFLTAFQGAHRRICFIENLNHTRTPYFKCTFTVIYACVFYNSNTYNVLIAQTCRRRDGCTHFYFWPTLSRFGAFSVIYIQEVGQFSHCQHHDGAIFIIPISFNINVHMRTHARFLCVCGYFINTFFF